MGLLLFRSIEAIAKTRDGGAMELRYPAFAQAQQDGDVVELHAMLVVLDHNRLLHFRQLLDFRHETMLDVAP